MTGVVRNLKIQVEFANDDILDQQFLHVSWDAVPNTTGYAFSLIVQFEPYNTDSYYSVFTENINDTKFTVSGEYRFSSGVYGVSVSALPNGLPSLYFFRGGYIYPPIPAGAITNLYAWNDGQIDTHVSWDAASDATSYLVQMVSLKDVSNVANHNSIYGAYVYDTAYMIRGFGEYEISRYNLAVKVTALPDGEPSYFIFNYGLSMPSKWEWYTPKVSDEKFNLTAIEWNEFCKRINHYGAYYGYGWRHDYE